MISFKLAKTQAKKFSVSPYVDKDEHAPQQGFVVKSLEVRLGVADNDKHNFAIILNVVAENDGPNGFVIEVEFWGYFQTEQEFTDEFLESHFTSVNAPAITYPYLRSFITNILVGAGYPAKYLPTINFSATAEQQENQDKE